MPRRIIGWRMVRPRRALGALGTRIYYNPDAPPKADVILPYPFFPQQPNWSCAPGLVPGQKFGACIPLPGGQTISVTVAQPTVQPAAPASVQGTVDRVKAWLQEKSLVAGYENWKVTAAAAGLFWLVRK